MAKIIDLNPQNFEAEVLKADNFVLVDFWAIWCMPCRMMSEVLEELTPEFKGKLKIVKVNVDEPASQELVMRYRIQSIPNLKIFKNGQIIKEITEFKPKDILREEINTALK